MRRRAFITLLGGAAAWPLAARAQQAERVRRIGIIQTASSDDAEYQARVGALLQELQQLGWMIGRNIRIDTRWTKGDPDDARKYAAELVALAPDAIVATGISTVGPLLQLTRTIPIVFPAASDPVAAGLVESLARPGGNLTGINLFSGELTAERLEFLREMVPGAARIAVLVNPANATTTETTLRDVQSAAGAMGLQIQVLNASTIREINAAFATLVRERPDAVFVGLDVFF